MIKEAYVSFEVAKLLKEKGFDIPCYGRYSVRSQEFHLDTTKPCNNGGISQYSAPTHQVAMSWLRKKGLHINITYKNLPMSIFLYYWSIVEHEEIKGLEQTYEEAVEEALKYVLENFI